MSFLVSCSIARESDYENAANDLCNCINKNSDGISESTKSSIISLSKSDGSMEDVFAKMTINDPELIIKDGEALMQLGVKIEGCGKEIEKKYDNIYTNESDEEIQKRFLEILGENGNCEWTYALVKLGLKEKSK